MPRARVRRHGRDAVRDRRHHLESHFDAGVDSQQLTEVRCAGAIVGPTLIALAVRPASLRIARHDLPLLVALGVGDLALVQRSYFDAIHPCFDRDRAGDLVRRPAPRRAVARFVYDEQGRLVHPARRARSARRDPVSLSACGFLFATVFWSLLSPWWLVAALRHITATRAGVMAMLDPVLAVVVAWLWLGESLDLTQSSGAAVTVAGIALAQTSR